MQASQDGNLDIVNTLCRLLDIDDINHKSDVRNVTLYSDPGNWSMLLAITEHLVGPHYCLQEREGGCGQNVGRCWCGCHHDKEGLKDSLRFECNF